MKTSIDWGKLGKAVGMVSLGVGGVAATVGLVIVMAAYAPVFSCSVLAIGILGMFVFAVYEGLE